MGAAVLLVTGCVSRRDAGSAVGEARYEYQKPEMGLPFRLVFYASDRVTADAAAAAVFARIERLNDILSDYEFDSELSALSRTAGQGKAVPVSDELWKVLSRAQALAEESAGAFDITVGPCVSLWRKARREHKLPDRGRLEEARAAVGYRKLRLNSRGRTAQLLVPGMRLDLGGIAKGYALDEAMKVLRSRGVIRALVSGGGDMVAGDPPVGKRAWRIELAPLDATNAPPVRFVALRNAALATSGDLFQRLEIDGQRYSHIVDPRTGLGLTDHSLVTVIAPDGITADSLTKVASILEKGRAMRIIESKFGVAARVVRKPGADVEVFESRRFRRYYD